MAKLAMPTHYSVLDTEEVEYDGGFMDGWNKTEKVFGWIGIIAGATLVISGIGYGVHKYVNSGNITNEVVISQKLDGTIATGSIEPVEPMMPSDLS